MTAENVRIPLTTVGLEARAIVSDQPAELVKPASRPITVIGPPAFSVGAVLAGLRLLVQYFDLFVALSLFRLRIRYKQSVLGWLWAAVQPLALMGIYTFVFAHVAKVDTGGMPYPAFVFCGLLPWIFFSSSITNAVQGMVAHPGLLTKMYFPREIIPLSYLTAGAVDFLISSVILAGILVHYRVTPTWNLLYCIPILMILGGFAAALALFCSAVHVRVRDVGLALPFVLQVWMFATPVVYSSQAVPARFRSLYLLNPAAAAIDSFRGVILWGHPPRAFTLTSAFIVTMVGLALAYAYFKWSEAAMADVV
jgi:lipopolysaccharide transport system permease protein